MGIFTEITVLFVDKLWNVLDLAVALVVTLIPLPCTQLYRARKCVSAMRDAAGDLVKISQMGFGKRTCLLSYISLHEFGA